jgi:type VI secretion system protein ImpC
LPVHTFPTDDGGVAMKCPTEIAISDRREFELSNPGFLPLIHCKNRDFAAFMGARSCRKPRLPGVVANTTEVDFSIWLNYLLCASRFVHYLKAMTYSKIRSFTELRDCERWLNEWIMNYVITAPEGADEESKARKPLSDAGVVVREVTAKPGWCELVAWLRPHFQLETLTTWMSLVAEVPR